VVDLRLERVRHSKNTIAHGHGSIGLDRVSPDSRCPVGDDDPRDLRRTVSSSPQARGANLEHTVGRQPVGGTPTAGRVCACNVEDGSSVAFRSLVATAGVELVHG
jgi:hypothetical protein